MEVEMICDRVVIMDKGRIIQEGTIEELTGQTGAVRFDCRPVPAADELERILGGGPAPRVDERGFEVPLAEDRTDGVIDRLRAAGVSIRAVIPRKRSLEDSFIELVQRKEGAQ
jgi:ABC-2 type transport system ATP-binding protein